MTGYRRNFIAGGSFFFTVNLAERRLQLLTKAVKGCSELKSWAMRIARRAGMSKAKVALARRLAVIMHRMLVDGTPFDPANKQIAAAA